MIEDPREDREDAINRAFAAYLRLVDAGTVPDLDNFLAAHSTISAELRELITTASRVKSMASGDGTRRWAAELKPASVSETLRFNMADVLDDTGSPPDRVQLFGEYDRFLRGEPVEARRLTSIQRAWFWLRGVPLVAYAIGRDPGRATKAQRRAQWATIMILALCLGTFLASSAIKEHAYLRSIEIGVAEVSGEYDRIGNIIRETFPPGQISAWLQESIKQNDINRLRSRFRKET